MSKYYKNEVAFLGFVERPNCYRPVDIKLLDIFPKTEDFNNSIIELDSFTKVHNTEEILEAIKRSNIVLEDTFLLDLPMIVYIPNRNKALPVLTKEVADDWEIVKMLETIVANKQLSNKFYNKYVSLLRKTDEIYKESPEFIKHINSLKESLNNGNGAFVYNFFNNCPYGFQRAMYFYIIESLQLAKNEQERKRKKDN